MYKGISVIRWPNAGMAELEVHPKILPTQKSKTFSFKRPFFFLCSSIFSDLPSALIHHIASRHHFRLIQKAHLLSFRLLKHILHHCAHFQDLELRLSEIKRKRISLVRDAISKILLKSYRHAYLYRQIMNIGHFDLMP